MSRFVKLAVLCGVLFTAGCKLANEGTEIANNLTGKEIPKEDVKSGKLSLANDSDTVSITLPVVAGKTYVIEINDTVSNVSVYGKVIAQNGTLLDSGSYAPSFVAKTTEDVTVKFYTYSSATGAIPFSYSITATDPVSADLSGKWILVSNSYSAYGKTQSVTYSASNAQKVIEFRNDTIVRYDYSTSGDSAYSSTGLFAESYLSDMKYSLDGTTLTFTLSNANGSATEVYQKFTGTISSIRWEDQNLTVDPKFIGVWYLSSDQYKWTETEDGISETEDTTINYASAALAKSIYRVESDSITRYYRSGFGVDSSKRPASEYSWMLRSLTVNGTTASAEYVEFDVGQNYEEYGYEIETYTKYTGALPPAEWLVVNVPSSAQNFAAGTSDTISVYEGDTIWYKLPVVSGESYDLTFNYNNCNVGRTLLDNNKKIVKNNFYGTTTISASASGYYYLGMIVSYQYNEAPGTIALSFNKSTYENQLTSRSAITKPVPAEPKDPRDNRFCSSRRYHQR